MRAAFLVAVLSLTVLTTTARAQDQPVRGRRALAASVLLPDWSLNGPDSCCFPAPGVQLAFNVHPRLALDLSFAALSGDHGAFVSTASAGVRAYLTQGESGLYLAARIVRIRNDPDEGSTEDMVGPLAGPGFEWVSGSGVVTVGIEVTAGGLRREDRFDGEVDWVRDVRTVLSFGLRFGVPSPIGR